MTGGNGKRGDAPRGSGARTDIRALDECVVCLYEVLGVRVPGKTRSRLSLRRLLRQQSAFFLFFFAAIVNPLHTYPTTRKKVVVVMWVGAARGLTSRSLGAPAILHRRLATAMSASPMQQLAASNPRIILGSSSSSRRQIMDELAAQHGLAYDVVTADIDEKAIRLPEPRDLVLRLAHAKADAVLAKLAAAAAAAGGGVAAAAPPAGLLLTCDQVVVHEGRILEKPADEAEAREFVAGYARAPASTVGSVVCTDLRSGRRLEAVDVAEVGGPSLLGKTGARPRCAGLWGRPTYAPLRRHFLGCRSTLRPSRRRRWTRWSPRGT
jgi:predicted house-cleaning NTP pyrophosphatase (Maf/HAM1 superfamily)